MSEANGRKSPSDTEVLFDALDHLQAVQEDHGKILTNLEARPILDLTGMERRQEELHDELVRIATAFPRPRRRPWWWTPSLVSLALLVGIAVGWETMAYGVRWGVVQVQVPVRVQQAIPKKGK
jgi:hypothetical protein